MRKSIILLASLILSLVARADNIVFADNHVKTVCVEHWDTDGDGELSEEEAAKVFSLDHYFSRDTQVSSFDELRYFTNLALIHSSEFNSCSYLKSIQLPPQVSSIGDNAFRNCVRLKAIDIPSSVEKIDESAFNGCVRMESVTFHEGLATIGVYAFSTCKSLQSISIPASLTSLESSAFQGCNSVESISVAEGNTVYDSREDCNALVETKANTLVLGCYNSTFPESVTAIGYSAFSGCAKLQQLDIPDHIVSIGASAFSSCSGLVSVKLPSSLTVLDTGVFSECTSLTDVLLPEGLTSIGVSAFSQCRSLERISIPASVTTLSSNSFFECPNLVEVTVGFATPVSITSSTFPNRKYATLYVPIGSVEAFRAANYWKDFYQIVEWFPTGDVNHDGAVNVLDVTLVIDYILDKNPENFHYEEANVNGDEYINVLDVTKSIDIILGK